MRSRHRERKKLEFIPEDNGCSISLPGRIVDVMYKAMAMLAGQDVTSTCSEAREHAVARRKII